MFPTRVIAALGLLLADACADAQIRSLAELRALPVEVASTRIPVEIEATTLYSDLMTGGLILHDGTAASYVGLWHKPQPKVGDRVRLSGHSDAPGYLPHVSALRLEIIGRSELPPPHPLAPGEIYQPRVDTGWVEVPALVTGVESGGLAYTLVVEIYGQHFKADIPLTPDAVDRAARLMQRQVRMTAVLGTVYNDQHQLTGRHFFVPSFDHLVLDGPEADASTVRQLKIGELLTAASSPTDLVRVEGIVTQTNAKGCYVRDTSCSTLVLTPSQADLRPGALVAIDGFGAIAPFRPILRATRVIKTGQTNAPPPQPMDFHPKNGLNQHMELVTLDAEFLGLRSGKDEAILQCRSGQDIFEATLPQPAPTLSRLNPGDRIALAGICELVTNHPLPRLEWVTGFRLQLANADAIRILRRAPWWTTRRLTIALSGTGLAALIAIGAVAILRRQVKHQVGIIAKELETNAVSSERERIARDLHDTLEQQLTGVAMQLESLAKSPQSQSPGISDRISLASRMLHHSREEARRSVWDLRSRVLENHGFAAALESLAASAAIDGGPHVTTNITGARAHLPSAITYQLLRMAQEALANALKHARAENILISLDMTSQEYHLAVSDDGRGFDANPAHPPGPPHFGLIGMRERASRIGADLTITSRPGHGCTVAVTLPIQPT
jgi:signal transduction histidine kinase